MSFSSDYPDLDSIISGATGGGRDLSAVQVLVFPEDSRLYAIEARSVVAIKTKES
jgi:hypothetical protein